MYDSAKETTSYNNESSKCGKERIYPNQSQTLLRRNQHVLNVYFKVDGWTHCDGTECAESLNNRDGYIQSAQRNRNCRKLRYIFCKVVRRDKGRRGRRHIRALSTETLLKEPICRIKVIDDILEQFNDHIRTALCNRCSD